MIVSINQPAYLPWAGYFHRIAASDVHVVLDHVQFEKNSFTNRNKVRTHQGWTWLTVPVRTKGRFGDLAINRAEIAAGPNWARKHWDTLRLGYAKAPYFQEHARFFQGVYSREWTSLDALLRETTNYLLEALGIGTRILYSSQMSPQGSKAQMVLNLCRTAGAQVYFSGALGRDYLCELEFEEAGIRVAYQEYLPTPYPQLHPGFEPFMSAVDLLFNCGPQSLSVLMSGNMSTGGVRAMTGENTNGRFLQGVG